MDELRKPLFIIALILALLIVLVETGSNLFSKGEARDAQAIRAQLNEIDPELARSMDESLPAGSKNSLQGKSPPGYGIPDMALLDGLMLYSVCLMGISFLLTDRLIGRVQGVVTLIVSLVVLLVAIFKIIATLIKVFLMLGLFTAAPFGTIAYMAMWGFFDRGTATALLSLLLFLKLAFAVCLILAHQRFLQNKGLVAIILFSLLANLIVSFLHGLVPVFLVSITDGVAGIIVLIIAAIWAIILLIGAIISILKALV